MNKLDEITKDLVKLSKKGRLNEYKINKAVEKEVTKLRKFKKPDHPLRCAKCHAKGRRNMCPESHFNKKGNIT